MKTSGKIKIPVAENKYTMFFLRYSVSAFAVFIGAFILLRYSSYSSQGVKKGIILCLESLVPSLYPFMILTQLYTSSEAAYIKSAFVDKICRRLFKLPGGCMPVILFSFIGGLPIGASMTAELYERGVISRQQGERMLSFCVNPGPAFVISAVGASMLGSEKTGIILYASLILSALFLGLCSRFFSEKSEDYISAPTNKEKAVSKGTAIEKAVIKSSKAIFKICAWVVAFSCIGELIAEMNLNEEIKSFLLCTSEMTGGSIVAAESFSAPVVAAVIGFSGFCGHFQLMGYVSRIGMKYKYFLVSRIINSALSAVICSLLMKIFPVAKEIFSVGIKPEGSATSGSFMLSSLMIIMAVLFVVGDDYIVNKKKHKKV